MQYRIIVNLEDLADFGVDNDKVAADVLAVVNNSIIDRLGDKYGLFGSIANNKRLSNIYYIGANDEIDFAEIYAEGIDE